MLRDSENASCCVKVAWKREAGMNGVLLLLLLFSEDEEEGDEEVVVVVRVLVREETTVPQAAESRRCIVPLMGVVGCISLR